ncbi:OLC1v1035018C1 [Oldenlandia corymbosa var. corymbosa]|uniref:acetyl-CoA carboxytransferase n=1 Tax=Oldenlandia corymbosa var. corymbosa TaxID=529605 RepID=A0AAV1CTR4_OLDCO|nr:OLC1v1035018C1 [Oldenlandia corymbosa var. corymbosa]
MAAATHPSAPFTGNLVSKPSASDLLRSSRNGVSGIPLRALGKAQIGARRRDLTVSAKLRKVKKRENPWPADPDPNVRGGILSHLSPFKPLKEKPKPVTLDFEKPLMDLQKKIIDVQRMANETGLDFSDQIISLENKYQQALKDLYTHLTPIQRVNIARHPNRPTFLDHVFNITEKFVELHGDRAGYDDPAVVTGLGTINGKCYMFMGHQKGRNTKENIQRNFGMPTPHGYRKAMRMMYYADHHNIPIVTFIDTPGAYADLKSEELGQGEAIAHNLRTMFGLKVPVISIVIGEGGSGGALAIGCANKLLMLENAVFYVASPEACAAILWKSAKAAPKAAEKLKITATELCKLQIADGVIPEPLGGAHADPHWTSQQIKASILNAMDELDKMDTPDLLKHRNLKFRKIGGFQEGIPIDPIKKVNMKKKDLQPGKTPVEELRNEVEKLKQQIQKAKESSDAKKPESGLKELIAKLKSEVDYEYTAAVKALGFEDKIATVREEFAKDKSATGNTALKEKMDKLTEEFNQTLPAAANYSRLKKKLDMLREISRVEKLSRKGSKEIELQQEINKRFKELTERPDIKQKLEALEIEKQTSGMSESVKEKILSLKDEIQLEFSGVLESMGLQVNAPELAVAKEKLDKFNSKIKASVEHIASSSELKNKIELLKSEVAKAGKTPSSESKAKIEALEQEIKTSLAGAVNFPPLQEEFEQLKVEISEAIQSSGGTNGSMLEDAKYDSAPKVETHV